MVDCRNCIQFDPEMRTCAADNNAVLKDELVADPMDCHPYIEVISEWKRLPCVYM